MPPRVHRFRGRQRVSSAPRHGPRSPGIQSPRAWRRSREDRSMTVVVSGRGLRPATVLRVAREREPVMLDPDAARRMQRARAVVEQVLSEGRPTYGLTTGVGVLKRVAVAAADSEVADATMLERHRVGLGSAASADVTRATAVCLLNGLATGF